ncbi:hypothetical protein U1Q18_017195 [Sarracenia purpurea var. burkii]
MGESPACLVRSFSACSSSEPNKGDPLRALTTSISFGRFLTESSGWEKWSCFSYNRYLEEAEKYSKSGSVAEKKAYFEAHYKRIAAKKAAMLLEQQNIKSDDSAEAKVMDEIHNDSSMVSVDVNTFPPNVERNKVETNGVKEELTIKQLVISDNLIHVENESGSVAEKKAYFEAHYKRIAAKKAAMLLEQQNIKSDDSAEAKVMDEIHNDSSMVSVDVNTFPPNVERNKVETNGVKEELTIKQLVISDNLIHVENELPNQHQNVENPSKIMFTRQEKRLINDAANQGNLASKNKKQSLSSAKSFTTAQSSKLRTSLKLSSVQSRKDDRAIQTSRKAASDVVEKKRSTPKSLHMSINSSSNTGETSKSSSPIIPKIGNSRSLTTFVKSFRDSSITLRTPTRVLPSLPCLHLVQLGCAYSRFYWSRKHDTDMDMGYGYDNTIKGEYNTGTVMIRL